MKPILILILMPFCFPTAICSKKEALRYFQIMTNPKVTRMQEYERYDADKICPSSCTIMYLPGDYITCVQCIHVSRKEENCHVYKKLVIIEERPVVEEDPMRALRTLPYGFFVSKSRIPEAGLGLFTSVDIPPFVRLGPFGGSIHDDEFKDPDAILYSWGLIHDGKLSFVNGENVSYSNYLRYANTPSCKSDENMFAIQHNQKTYYITLNWIPAGSELLVWYGKSYGRRHLGLHKLECNKHVYFDPNSK